MTGDKSKQNHQSPVVLGPQDGYRQMTAKRIRGDWPKDMKTWPVNENTMSEDILVQTSPSPPVSVLLKSQVIKKEPLNEEELAIKMSDIAIGPTHILHPLVESLARKNQIKASKKWTDLEQLVSSSKLKRTGTSIVRIVPADMAINHQKDIVIGPKYITNYLKISFKDSRRQKKILDQEKRKLLTPTNLPVQKKGIFHLKNGTHSARGRIKLSRQHSAFLRARLVKRRSKKASQIDISYVKCPRLRVTKIKFVKFFNTTRPLNIVSVPGTITFIAQWTKTRQPNLIDYKIENVPHAVPKFLWLTELFGRKRYQVDKRSRTNPQKFLAFFGSIASLFLVLISSFFSQGRTELFIDLKEQTKNILELLIFKMPSEMIRLVLVAFRSLSSHWY